MSNPTNIDVDGRRTRVRVDGDPDRPTILLLHGIGRSLEDWTPHYRLAELAGYRTIAMDMPGFGFSIRPAAPMSLPVLARSITRTLEVLGVEQPLHVVGNSLGGAVALQLLTLQPDRVASLMLVGSAGFGSEVHPMLRMLATPGIGSFMARYTTATGARLMERQLYADTSLATRERIDHALAVAGQPETAAALHELACELGTFRGIRRQWRVKLLAEAAKHPRPTLIVWGDRDRILPVDQLAAARRLLPHARTHVFAGIGHMPQIECPHQFTQVLDGFLSTLPPGSPEVTDAELRRA